VPAGGIPRYDFAGRESPSPVFSSKPDHGSLFPAATNYLCAWPKKHTRGKAEKRSWIASARGCQGQQCSDQFCGVVETMSAFGTKRTFHRAVPCPLLRVKRTSRRQALMSAFGTKRTWGLATNRNLKREPSCRWSARRASVAGLPPGQQRYLSSWSTLFAGCAECRRTVTFMVPETTPRPH